MDHPPDKPTSDRASDEGNDGLTRKPYRRPVLTEYGSISKLTRSGGSTRAEGTSGRRRPD
jgi:hypothetical protein